MNDREIRLRGVERLIEMGKAGRATLLDDAQGGDDIGAQMTTWAANGREEVGFETILELVGMIDDFVRLVDWLGALGMNGGERDGTERAGADADGAE
jgi:hypothetical protein